MTRRATTDVPSRARRVREPLLLATGGIAAMALLRVHDPHESGAYAYCPFLTLTGQPCPLCGGLRAMNDLTHGNIAAALTSNAAAVAILVVGAVLIARWFWRRWRGEAQALLFVPRPVPVAVISVLMVGFTIYRWTPWGQWLYQS